ncbi:biotin/lipoyl-binding protein [archaeon]|nr:MAG: biotin/lipoyl-binding protein [archaeon]
MSGIVEKVMVKAGDAVTAGDVLAMVSAMKMEVGLGVYMEV